MIGAKETSSGLQPSPCHGGKTPPIITTSSSKNPLDRSRSNRENEK